MGTTVHDAKDFTVDSISWTRRRDEDGQAIFEKCASLSVDAALARQRLRNHYLVAFGIASAGVARPLGLSNTKTGLVLTLPWIAGLDLAAYVRGRCAALGSAALPARETLDIAYKIACILADLAKHAVVHRSLSPDHIVVDPIDGALSLLNFGSSRFIRGVSSSESDAIIDHGEDLRALGRLLYWLATGRELHAPSAARARLAGIQERIRDPLARLLSAGGRDGYWHAAAAADDLLRRRDAINPSPLGPRGAPPDLVLSTRRLGRKAGVDTLLAAYSEAAGVVAGDAEPSGAEGRRSLALVDGRGGVGKTTLVTDACHAMEQLGARVEFGKFNQFGDARPISALLHALDGALGQILEEDQAVRAAFATRILKALGDLAQVIVDVIPRLMLLLGPQPTAPSLSGEANRVRFELLLTRFVGAMAMPQRPLALVLDDLQWADQQSLDLMRGLLRESSIRHLLIIGVYRTETVQAGHPLLAAIQNIVADGCEPHKVSVTLWKRSDIVRFLDDIGIAADRQRADLADLLHQITEGNPLGVLMALRGVQDLGGLRFDAKTGRWRANVKAAGAALADSTILSLVGKQLARLPAACCDMVAVCALFGSSFNLERVAAGTGRSASDILALLWPALALGLLVPDEDPRRVTIARLRARHDIVQQAAYLTIGEERECELHGAIGRAMLDAYKATDTLQDHVFEVVQQFNKASTEGFSDEERLALIDLNVAASRAARATGSLKAASQHYMKALRLIDESDRTRRPKATFELMLNAAEATYLAAEFVEFDRLVSGLETLPAPPIDAARLQHLRIRSLITRNRVSEALKVGEHTLALLGADLAPMLHPSQWPAPPTIDKMMVGLPSDAKDDAILRTLALLTASAYNTSFDMYVRIILTMMELSMRRPFSPLTPISLCQYGLTLCGVGRNAEGVAAGQLAMALVERVDDIALACRVRVPYYGMVHHWSRPARECLQPLLDTVRNALLCGEVDVFEYCINHYWLKAWALEPVAIFEALLIEQTKLAEHFGREYSRVQGRLWLQFVQTLTGRAHMPLAMVGDVFDARIDVARLEAARDGRALFVLGLLTAILDWHRGDAAAALVQCRKAEIHATPTSSTLTFVDHVVLWCLCELEFYPTLAESERAEKLKWLDSSTARLRAWAEASPDNFAHKLALVEAEKARVLGDLEAARRGFEGALERAAASDFLHDRALIKERAGDFFGSVGEERLAHDLLLDAYRDYQTWGATAIAQAMATRHALPVDAASQQAA